MEIKYSFRETIPGCLHINIEPNENITGCIHNIDGWLTGDVQTGTDTYYHTYIKDILNGVAPEDECSDGMGGNAYDIVVRKDYTTIIYIFEDEDPEMVPCTLPTQMLLEILEIWSKAEIECRAKYEAEREAKN